MNLPLVSIIIPAYNSEEYLAGCIASVIAQTWPNKQIIIVNDGSTDGTIGVIEKFTGMSGIIVVSQKNKGASAARNAGLKKASGEYIQFLDADDLLSPDKIESQVACLNGSLTRLAICKTLHFNDGENHLQGTIGSEWFLVDSDNPIDFLIKLYAGDDMLPGFGGMIQPNAWLTPVELIRKAGVWNESLSLDDDGEFFCRVVLASEGIKFSSTGLNYYRKFTHRQNQSAQKSKRAVGSAVAAIDLKFDHLKAKSSNPMINKVFAKHYWWTGVLAYPQFKDLSKYCIQKAKQLGYSGEKYVGGRGGHLLSALFGWKMARLLATYRRSTKQSWV